MTGSNNKASALDVALLCTAAGRKDLAAGFLAAGATLAEVETSLAEMSNAAPRLPEPATVPHADHAARIARLEATRKLPPEPAAPPPSPPPAMIDERATMARFNADRRARALAARTAPPVSPPAPAAPQTAIAGTLDARGIMAKMNAERRARAAG